MLRCLVVTCCASALCIFSSQTSAETVRFRFDVADPTGNPLDTLSVGQSFLFRAFVQDLGADDPQGVFAAFEDVTYDSQLAAINGEIQHGPVYPNGQSGDLSSPGVLDDVGSFGGVQPVGDGEFWLFSVPMLAMDTGALAFQGRPADNSPVKDVLVYGLDNAVAVSDIDFGSLSVSVVPEPSSLWLVTASALSIFGFSRRRRRRGRSP